MANAPRSSTQADRGAEALSLDAAVLNEVPVTLRAKLGEATLSVAELLGLGEGSIVPLDRTLNDVIELRLNNAVVARGEIVAVGDRFAVRIVEIAGKNG